MNSYPPFCLLIGPLFQKQLEILLFKFFMGVSLVSRLIFISYLPPVPNNLGASVLDFRKRPLSKRSGWHNILLERHKTCREKNEGLIRSKGL